MICVCGHEKDQHVLDTKDGWTIDSPQICVECMQPCVYRPASDMEDVSDRVEKLLPCPTCGTRYQCTEAQVASVTATRTALEELVEAENNLIAAKLGRQMAMPDVDDVFDAIERKLAALKQAEDVIGKTAP